MTDYERLQALAEAIASGDDVDWTDTDPENPVVRNLRVVASISGALRDLDTRVRELAPGSRWGRLEIRAALDRGASSQVYLAWDPALEREVALKLYDAPSERRREHLRREGRLLARLDHPGVVRVFGAEDIDGAIGLWMERLEGETLAQRLARGETLGPEEALTWGAALCDALAAVHGAGIVHGDIKAQNVMRRSDGRIVLMDFGAGRSEQETDREAMLRGTPLYLAPEVLGGEPQDRASDIYALGTLLFHGLTGRFPVEAETVPQLMVAHRDRGAALLEDLRPGLPAPLLDVVGRALEPEPEDRWKSAGEMRRRLEAVPGEAAPGRRRRAPWVLASAIVVLGLLIGSPWSPLIDGGREYTLESSLARITPDGSVRPLGDGARVSVDDLLVLELAVSRPTHVYVFNEDDAGRGYRLFPLPDGEPSNPLPAGKAIRLPSPDGRLAWRVTSAGGTERIHLVTSPDPLPQLMQRLDLLTPARRAGAGDALRTRGVGGLADTAGLPPPSPTAAVLAETRKLTGEGALTGTRHRVFELDHSD